MSHPVDTQHQSERQPRQGPGRRPERHPDRRRRGARVVAAASAGVLLLASAGAASAAAPGQPAVPAVVAPGEPAHSVDALSAGPLAAVLGTGVLLTATGSLPQATADRLAARRATLVYVVGGPGAVSQHVLDQIEAAVPGDGPSVVRLAGDDRYATAARVTKAAEEFVEAPLEP